MKKIVKIALTSAIAVTMAATNVSAAGLEKYIAIGGSSVDVAGESGASGGISFGGMGVFDNGFVAGTSVNLDYGSVNSEDFISFDFDLKAGYSPINKLSIYGLIGVGGQNFDGMKAYGFGYGGGIDYRLTNAISIAVEYKTYDMNPDVGADFDYDKIGGYLKYYF